MYEQHVCERNIGNMYGNMKKYTEYIYIYIYIIYTYIYMEMQ